jgi:hypothetical protein
MNHARNSRRSLTLRWTVIAVLLATLAGTLALVPGYAHVGRSTAVTSADLPARTSGSGTGNQSNTVSATLLPDTLTTRGIYEFSGGNSGVDADNPDLAGTTLTFEWSQLEPKPGQFTWTSVDNAIAPWVAAGKQVILRVSTGGEASWGARAAQATPGWVFTAGVPAIHDDGATLPAYWDATFLADYDAFVAAYAARYDGDPAVSFIEIGIGDGGETLPDTQEGPGNRSALWARYGYSDSLWLATVENRLSARFRGPLTRV